MHFCISNQKSHVPLKMTNMQLADVEATNFLGLPIQSNLKWNVHITELNTKLSSLLLCISEFFQILSAFMQFVAFILQCAFPPEIWHNILGKLILYYSDLQIAKENYSNNEKYAFHVIPASLFSLSWESYHCLVYLFTNL